MRRWRNNIKAESINTPKIDKIKSKKRCLKMRKYSKEFKEEALKIYDEIGVKKANDVLKDVLGFSQKTGRSKNIRTQ